MLAGGGDVTCIGCSVTGATPVEDETNGGSCVSTDRVALGQCVRIPLIVFCEHCGWKYYIQ